MSASKAPTTNASSQVSPLPSALGSSRLLGQSTTAQADGAEVGPPLLMCRRPEHPWYCPPQRSSTALMVLTLCSESPLCCSLRHRRAAVGGFGGCSGCPCLELEVVRYSGEVVFIWEPPAKSGEMSDCPHDLGFLVAPSGQRPEMQLSREFPGPEETTNLHLLLYIAREQWRQRG